MDPLALGLIATAAVLHSAWNILLKGAADPLRTATVGMVVGSVIVVPLVGAAWLVGGRPAIPAATWVLGAVSGLVEVAYFVFLSAAYRRGDLSVVYPVARGTAPVLAVVIGVGVLGERLLPSAVLGVALLVTGLLVVQRPWRFLGREHAAQRVAAGFALLTGLMTATYSAIDRVAVQLVAPWLYVAILWPACAGGLVVVHAWLAGHTPAAASQRSSPARPGGRDDPAVGARGIAGGVLMLGAYATVLAALSIAPLAIIGPLREVAVILIATWGIVRLRETAERSEIALRLAGSALVVLGVILLAAA